MVTLNWNGKSNFDEYKLHKIRFYLKVSFTSRVLKFFLYLLVEWRDEDNVELTL